MNPIVENDVVVPKKKTIVKIKRSIKPKAVVIEPLVIEPVVPAEPAVYVDVRKNSIWISSAMKHRRRHVAMLAPPSPTRNRVKAEWPYEDISDDEADEEGELERRVYSNSSFKLAFERAEYEEKLYGLQMAGYFLDW